MQIEENCIVTLTYELRNGDSQGELLERMDAHYPFQFMYGSGRLLPAFERQLAGLHTHDTFEFVLSPEQAYGPVSAAEVAHIPLENFREANGKIARDLLQLGQFVNLMDTNGQTVTGKVTAWNDEYVTVDCNHAMAGKTLHFKGSVLHLRSATVEELIQRRYIAPDGVHNEEDTDDDWWRN